jgi:hypothetical protein
VPENSLFPSKSLAALCLVSFCITLSAQVHKVDPEKTLTLAVTGATAAYSLDPALAEASADNGTVSITGKQPGTTHIVVIAPSGLQTLEVLITTPPPHYPPGFVMPVNVAEATGSGYFEGRYYSSPAEIQSQVDFLKIDGEDRTHVHIVETSLLGPVEPGQSRIALSSATYQILTPYRDITLFDQYVDESPLTINGSIIRGFHMKQGNWFVHGGYTSVATFDGLFLPLQAEFVVGGGYRQPITENSTITASFYHIDVPSTDLIGHSGSIGTLSYKYSLGKQFWFKVDGGVSKGIGGAGRLYYKADHDNITALVRYIPLPFASLGANNFRGFHSDFSWTRHISNRLSMTLTFYNNNLVLPDLRETTISSSVNIGYQFARHWTATGGAIVSSFQTELPALLSRSFTLPVGLSFQSNHFGAMGQYQFAATHGNDSGARQFRGSLRSGWGAFNFTAYAERDTNAPTLSFILGQVAGLQQSLNLLGIRATSVQQIDELLSNSSFLIAAGYIKGATVNLVPLRTQVGGTAAWSGRGAHRQQLSYSYLYNDNHSLQGNAEDSGHTLAYSQRIADSEDVSLGCSMVGVKNPGSFAIYTPICFVGWRHQFERVPSFIAPERQGTIRGNVFRDDESKGAFAPGMAAMAEVEIRLDDRRRTRSGPDGSYRFTGVPHGEHRVVAVFSSQSPFFFTTASGQEAVEDSTINFGIGYSLSGLLGQISNDAGQGVPDVSVVIRSRGLKWSATTDAGGNYFVSSLVAGEYGVQVDEDTLPAGYSAETLGDPELVTIGAS